jgi:hypothetical protein
MTVTATSTDENTTKTYEIEVYQSASGSAGSTLTGTKGTYNTFVYPAPFGTWTTSNSKEGSPPWTTNASYNTDGANGSYYYNPVAEGACPTGWHVPTADEVVSLYKYCNCAAVESATRTSFNPSGSNIGRVRYDNGNATGASPLIVAVYDGNGSYVTWTAANIVSSSTTAQPARCVKN